MRGEVIKNHLELLVLTALKTEPGHGYSIIRAVRDRSDGECELLEGSLPRSPPPRARPSGQISTLSLALALERELESKAPSSTRGSAIRYRVVG